MKIIKNITVATDLSKNAQTAFNYALTQALEWNSTVPIWVLHDEDKA